MRFLHTADWHLGRIFHGTHLTEDQAVVLDQLVQLAKESRLDALLVSGDIFDRAVPPPDAVSLLDDVLSRLVLDVRVPVILIAGNHDSPDRLHFGSRLLAGQGLHVVGRVDPTVPALTLGDSAGPVDFFPIPFAEPGVVRDRIGEPGIQDHGSAMQCLVERFRSKAPTHRRSVAVAHTFIAGSESSESERPLSVGGIDTVDASVFAGFHYVALGHLHRPQGRPESPLQYAGSLLKYSFSEADQPKSVNIVEMDAHGTCRVERIPLIPARDVRRLEGTFDEFLRTGPNLSFRNDYLQVTLLDREPILDAMGRLRNVFPNLLHIERPHLNPQGDPAGPGKDHRTLNDSDLFATFFSQMTGEPLSEAEAVAFQEVVEQIRMEEREAD
ncbi:MAG: exonuclease SbcCD subunit D [Thermodesulfobacteriota bacterium]|nr:exonuclease SbcCD subunit D [Thermodesulfobacteriota bacterium]